MAAHGCYPCSGRDAWVAVACRTDREFASLCQAIGRPDLASDAGSRPRNRDELDALIAEWTARCPKEEAAEGLQAAGVPAMPVLTVPELLADPHLKARGFFEQVAHPVAGTWPVEGPHWSLRESPAHIRLPAPAFGEHNYYVLRELLGLTDQQLETLRERGVTGGPA